MPGVARAAGEVGRVCTELLFGYRRHPAWDGPGRATCYVADELEALEDVIPGIAATARFYSDVVEIDGSHQDKAGPCANTEGLDPFMRMRAKMDGCLTGSRLAKDRAAEALTLWALHRESGQRHRAGNLAVAVVANPPACRLRAVREDPRVEPFQHAQRAVAADQQKVPQAQIRGSAQQLVEVLPAVEGVDVQQRALRIQGQRQVFGHFQQTEMQVAHGVVRDGRDRSCRQDPPISLGEHLQAVFKRIVRLLRRQQLDDVRSACEHCLQLVHCPPPAKILQK